MRLGLIFAIVFTYSSCAKKVCFDTVRLSDPDKISLYAITGEGKHCVYPVQRLVSIGTRTIVADGSTYLQGNSIFLDLDSIGDAPIRFFNFSTSVNKCYSIFIKSNLSKFKQSATYQMCLTKILTRDDVKIYEFRLAGSFRRRTILADEVFFVTKQNGVIGYYITFYDQGRNVISIVNGDILKDKIDYTRFSFVMIE